MHQRKEKKLPADSPEFKAGTKRNENKVGKYVSNFLWIAAFVYVLNEFDIVDVIIYDPRVKRTPLKISGFCLLIAATIAVYCALILDKIFNIEDYEKHSPWAVPLSTFSGVVFVVTQVLFVFFHYYYLFTTQKKFLNRFIIE
eukprot:m.81411 g.81411  ORF g.81411 m.81411 type:complete len:142 (-) comp12812_c0_seq4:1106-1531(-)